MRNKDCELCGLCNVANNVCIWGEGDRKAKVMIIGDNPGFVDDRKDEIFTGKVGDLLRKLFSDFHVDPDDFYFTNAVKCRTPEKKQASAKQMKACKPYLEEEIEEVNPQFILLLGAIAVKSVLGKAKITEIHGSIIEKEGITYMPTFHPAMAIRDPKKLGPIRNDIRKFIGLITGKSIEAKAKLNFEIVNDTDTLYRCIKDIESNDKASLDLETTGLNRFAIDAKVTTVIVGVKGKQWIIFFNNIDTVFSTHGIQQSIVELLAKALEGREVSGANFKFDNLWLSYHYGVFVDFTFDTGLAAHILNENELQGLKYQARNVFNAEDWDIDLKSKKAEIPDKAKIAKYGAGDGYWTRRLATHQDKQLKVDNTQSELYRKLVIPVSRVYEKIETNGVYVDVKNMEKAGKKFKRDRSIARKKLDRVAKELGHKEVNWNSPDQVGAILFDTLAITPIGYTDGGKPSSGADYLGRMKDEHEIIQHLLDYRGAEKMISSFIEGWNKRMVDGKWLHPGFKIGGTVTGRPSCSNPNFQQTPRNKSIRSLIGAPDGWTHFQLDYSQLELRIAAIISGCIEMLGVFMDGGDIHTATASAVSGIPYDMITSDERKKAKAVNFGFIYGMGYRKFKDYALDKYGVKVTDAESKAFRRRYFERYPGLAPWHERQKRIVHSLGQVRTMTGRIRHLPEIYSPDTGLVAQAERNAINSPVQGFGGEMTLMALVDIDREFDITGDELQVSGTVHDAITGRVRNELAGEILPQLQKLMEHPTLLDEFDIELPIDLVVDLDVGNWGNGVTLEEFLKAA